MSASCGSDKKDNIDANAGSWRTECLPRQEIDTSVPVLYDILDEEFDFVDNIHIVQNLTIESDRILLNEVLYSDSQCLIPATVLDPIVSLVTGIRGYEILSIWEKLSISKEQSNDEFEYTRYMLQPVTDFTFQTVMRVHKSGNRLYRVVSEDNMNTYVDFNYYFEAL